MDEPESTALRQQLDRTEDALERSEKFAIASQYASAILHEVNNPLEAITNLVYLAKAELKDSDQVFQYLLVVEDQLRILAGVTGQALAFHRDQSEAKPFDLGKIAEAALTLHSDKFARHQVVVERRIRKGVVADMFGNEILQIISNLLINAVDVLSMQGKRIWLRVSRCVDCVHLSVFDEGPGIRRDLIPKLFSPYVTGKKTGTGIGLWLSRRIAEKHGGTLRFRTSSKGTVFRLSLPTVWLENGVSIP